MSLSGSRTFVGFGFGAIQAGLLLYEAFKSGNFHRLVVAEVVPDAVAAVRQAGGRYTVNIAQAGGIEQAEVGPIEIEDPASAAGRQRLVEAIVSAEEIATAVPGVRYYTSPGDASLHRILAHGLRQKAARRGPRAIVYAAENHNQAAEILKEHVMAAIPEGERAAVRGRVRFLNTVIGKMSGVVTDAAAMSRQGLVGVTPESRRAFLVEAFNRILISRVSFPNFQRGITVFEEKDDLLPFEEAKLYGHNATHALAAYVGALCGARYIADLRKPPGMMPFLRAAFISESGKALIRRWGGVDALFTPDGYTLYADDLLARMFNPNLGDTVERVGRDAQRKLAWDDRLIGTIRTALDQRVEPRRYALGAAAALAVLHPSIRGAEGVGFDALLDPLWQGAIIEKIERIAVVSLIARGHRTLTEWERRGMPDLEEFLQTAFGNE